MLNPQRIRLLVELNRRGTLAAVADALAYSRSSVSQQLGQLQAEAGVALIEPVGRRVRLTTAGQILVRHGEQILHQLDLAEAELAATRSSIVGELRIATFQTAAIAIIPRLLDLLRGRHAGLEVFLSEIQPDAGRSALLAGEFDLVLGEHYPTAAGPGGPAPSAAVQIPSGLDERPLFTDPLRLWAGAGERSWIGHRLADFAEADWVFEPRGKPARRWAEETCRAAGFEPRVRFESADLLVHAQLVQTGHATALLPDLLWRSRSTPGRSVRLPGDPHREVYTAVREATRRRPALVELRRVLVEASIGADRDTPEDNTLSGTVIR